jgi:putative serine protease PepD
MSRLGVLAVIAASVAAGCSSNSGLSTSSSSATSAMTSAATSSPTSAASSSATSAAVPAAAPVKASTDATALQSAFVQVIKDVRPSVVEISTDDGLGSGVVFDGEGNIVTNAHVVGTSTNFKVTLSDGRTLDATLVGVYAPDDLAVINVSGSNLPDAASFADSSQVETGDVVLAIGNPLGLSSSVTEGIVSETGRTVDEGNGVVLPSTIQTSAPINPGNSGGALVDLDGAVVGIPTLAALDPDLGGSAAPGIGFAIPSNTVKLIADQLVNGGTVTNSGRAALGIKGATSTNLSGDPIGVLVRSTTPDQAAANAGITRGSIITAVAGQSTPDTDTLAAVLAGLTPNTKVSVSLMLPNGADQSVDVVLSQLS